MERRSDTVRVCLSRNHAVKPSGFRACPEAASLEERQPADSGVNQRLRHRIPVVRPQRRAEVIAQALEAPYLTALADLFDRLVDGAQRPNELRAAGSGLELGGGARQRTTGVHVEHDRTARRSAA
jgi:hypothetical protein